MLRVVWWNFEGIINHFELVQNSAVNAAALYSEQLNSVYEALAARYHLALINRKDVLRQYDSVPAHTAALIKAKIEELLEIEFLSHPAYCPALVSSDYYLIRSMAHFLRSGTCNSLVAYH